MPRGGERLLEKLYKHRKLLVALLAVVLILLLAPQLRGLTAQDILNYTPASLPLAALALVGIYCAKSVLMIIPTYGLYIAGGLLFPPLWAIAVGCLGLACELSLGFALGHWLGRDKVLQVMNKNAKAARFVTFLDSNGPAVCFITRVLPMPYPVDLGSMFFGASGMPYWQHLLFSLLGFSAVMIPITLAGGNLNNPLSAEFIVPFCISLVVCTGLFVAYQLWQRRRAATAPGNDADAIADDK